MLVQERWEHPDAARRSIRSLGRGPGLSRSPDAPPTLRPRRRVFSFPSGPREPTKEDRDDREDDDDPPGGTGARTPVGYRTSLARRRATVLRGRRRAVARLGAR